MTLTVTAAKKSSRPTRVGDRLVDGVELRGWTCACRNQHGPQRNQSMKKIIALMFTLSISVVACDAGPEGLETDTETSAVEPRAAAQTPTDPEVDRIIDTLEDENGMVDVRELADALDPSNGGNCKFQHDSKSCGMVCDTIGITCVVREDLAHCTVCTPAGCSKFVTDGCEPDGWPK